MVCGQGKLEAGAWYFFCVKSSEKDGHPPYLGTINSTGIRRLAYTVLMVPTVVIRSDSP